MAANLDSAERSRIETLLSAYSDQLRREIEGEKQDVIELAQSQAAEIVSQHQSDVSSDVFLEERALGTQRALEGELRLVEQALERLAAGTYGTCSECGATIPLERLRARPQAIRCIDCERQVAAR